MRQGQQNRRGRGRSTSTSNVSHNNNNNSISNNNGRKPQNPLSRNYESSGPDIKIRGTAAQIAEKYMTLARDASSSADVITAENYFQHAEHYNRIIMAAQAQVQVPSQPQPPAMGHHGHENGHAMGGPQRAPVEGNGAMRDQPQPQPQIMPAAVPVEQPVVSESVAEPVQTAPAAKEAEGGRRRRRRYPTNGAERPAGAAEADGDGHARSGDIASSGHPTDEALA